MCNEFAKITKVNNTRPKALRYMCSVNGSFKTINYSPIAIGTEFFDN